MRLTGGEPPAPTLALVAAVALHEAVRVFRSPVGAGDLLIKWPNDLLLGGAKLSGILLERSGDAVVIGFGVNLAHHPDDLDRAATSLAACIGHRARPRHLPRGARRQRSRAGLAAGGARASHRSAPPGLPARTRSAPRSPSASRRPPTPFVLSEVEGRAHERQHLQPALRLRSVRTARGSRATTPSKACSTASTHRARSGCAWRMASVRVIHAADVFMIQD